MSAVRKRIPAEIVSDPNVMGGEPVIRGTRIPAATIAAYLEAGHSNLDIFDDYPSLPIDGIDAVREWLQSSHAPRQGVIGSGTHRRMPDCTPGRRREE